MVYIIPAPVRSPKATSRARFWETTENWGWNLSRPQRKSHKNTRTKLRNLTRQTGGGVDMQLAFSLRALLSRQWKNARFNEPLPAERREQIKDLFAQWVRFGNGWKMDGPSPMISFLQCKAPAWASSWFISVNTACLYIGAALFFV